MLDFLEQGKTRVPVETGLGAKERTTNKLNTHMASMPGFEPLGQIGGRRVLRHCATLPPRFSKQSKQSCTLPLNRAIFV